MGTLRGAGYLLPAHQRRVPGGREAQHGRVVVRAGIPLSLPGCPDAGIQARRHRTLFPGGCAGMGPLETLNAARLAECLGTESWSSVPAGTPAPGRVAIGVDVGQKRDPT